MRKKCIVCMENDIKKRQGRFKNVTCSKQCSKVYLRILNHARGRILNKLRKGTKNEITQSQ